MSAKVLGQLAPASATYTGAVYTVPSGKEAICSTLAVSNRASTTDTFRVRIAIADASSDSKQWLAYDVAVAGNTIVPITIGLTLAATDKVYVGSNGGNLTFQLFGDER